MYGNNCYLDGDISNALQWNSILFGTDALLTKFMLIARRNKHLLSSEILLLYNTGML